MNSREIWWRVLLLSLWAGAANLWLQRHLGIGISDPFALLGITGGSTAFFLVLDYFLGSEEVKGIKGVVDKWSRDLLRRSLLSTPVLVLLYLSALILGSTYTSITVIPPREPKPLSVKAMPIDSGAQPVVGQVQAGGEPARLLLATSPFGRNVTLSISGYVSKNMTVYPLTGSTVDPEADLQPVPTVLFRPSIDSLASLADGGAINVYILTGAGCKLLGSISEQESGFAVMLGPPRPIPSGSPTLWQLDLEAAALDKPVLAATIRNWRSPLTVEGSPWPEPGDQVYVTVLSRAAKRKAEALVTVGRDVFQDVLVESEPAAQARCEEPS